MIYWKDFILDDDLGAVLNLCDEHLDGPSVMEDALKAFNQETSLGTDATPTSNTGSVRVGVQGETLLERQTNASNWMESSGIHPVQSQMEGVG